mmetsp:Transcript_15753/g.21889  ORF Transcript_15753/g.21889 Transcript_15753/m.21889 type:complete len:400 (+) Transcript_15753:208-1407(+)
MSAAAARRRKQLQARKKNDDQDAVNLRLQELLASEDLGDEATAYEALQLAQSQVRKRIKSADFPSATGLAYEASLSLLKKNRVSVASQLLSLLAEVLMETHTDVSDEWIGRIEELHAAHQAALGELTVGEAEKLRLQRLQKEFLSKTLGWSNDLGTVRFGHTKLHELLGQQCWTISKISPSAATDKAADDEDDEEYAISAVAMRSEAVTNMALAEQPNQIIEWLKTLPSPTDEQTKMGHQCPPADRDALLTRSLLLLCTIENLRDANTLLHGFIDSVEERPMDDLLKSYMSKDDGKSPAHVVFGSMLLRVCEKDKKTGPLYSWLLRSFKKEMDFMFKPQVIQSYTTKIGKVYFNIQPPPSMLSMMENMMGMMGGGGGGGGMNPAMMQAALAQAQAGGMM